MNDNYYKIINFTGLFIIRYLYLFILMHIHKQKPLVISGCSGVGKVNKLYKSGNNHH
jgi:hypothetical protein